MVTQDQLETLESKLQEKEELVAVLTARLEQAAERLDRLQRAGSDRGGRMAGGIPGELIDSQKSLLDDLQRAVRQWEEAQATTVLGRIEEQVAEIRRLILEKLESPAPLAGLPAERTAETGNATASSASGPLAWEALKQGLLKQAEEPPEPQPAAAPVCPQREPADLAAEEDHTADHIFRSSEPEHSSAEPPPPTPIDLEAATIDELRAAVEARDLYISFLIKQLRLVGSRQPSARPNWEELHNAPEQLLAHLKQLEGRLEQSLRISEVELSLERARLGREEVRLRQLSEQIDRQMKTLGLAPAEGASKSRAAGAAAPDAAGRRWLKFLGPRRDSTAST